MSLAAVAKERSQTSYFLQAPPEGCRHRQAYRQRRRETQGPGASRRGGRSTSDLIVKPPLRTVLVGLSELVRTAVREAIAKRQETSGDAFFSLTESGSRTGS